MNELELDFGFKRYALRDPHAAAVIEAEGAVWSRARLSDRVHRLARAWVEAGLGAGDALAVVAPNHAEHLAIHLAGLEAGLRVVPVNWHLTEDELAFVIADSGAKAIVADPRIGARRLGALAGADARALRLAIGPAPGFDRLDELAAAQPPRPLRGRPKGRVMAYTSATTGRPKAVWLPLSNAERALRKIVAWHVSLGILPGAGNVHLCASMLYHSAPLEGALIALHMGHCVVLADRFEPELALRLIERYRVTTSFMVPAMFVRLLKLPAATRRRYATASLRFVVHGGAPCAPEVKRQMIEWWGPIIWEAYGAAEAQGTIASSAEWLRFPGTVGRPIPGSAIRILDEAGCELPPGEPGLVYIKPHTGDRFEYKGNPSGSAASRRGELVTVGDIGYLNEHGFLFLCGRRSDLIISSGMNIYPAEIEHALVEHPAVLDCAVIGVAHELFGEVPKAVIQPAHGARPGPALTAELLEFLSARLSAMKLPKRIEYAAAIPRDPNGKLLRRRLREDRPGETEAPS